MNVLAAEISLVLDELNAELILTQHTQGVLNFEVGALSRLSQGASGPESSHQRNEFTFATGR